MVRKSTTFFLVRDSTSTFFCLEVLVSPNSCFLFGRRTLDIGYISQRCFGPPVRLAFYQYRNNKLLKRQKTESVLSFCCKFKLLVVIH